MQSQPDSQRCQSRLNSISSSAPILIVSKISNPHKLLLRVPKTKLDASGSPRLFAPKFSKIISLRINILEACKSRAKMNPQCIPMLTFSELFRKTLPKEARILNPLRLNIRFRQDCIKFPGEIGSCCPLSEPAEFSSRGAARRTPWKKG